MSKAPEVRYPKQWQMYARQSKVITSSKPIKTKTTKKPSYAVKNGTQLLHTKKGCSVKIVNWNRPGPKKGDQLNVKKPKKSNRMLAKEKSDALQRWNNVPIYIREHLPSIGILKRWGRLYENIELKNKNPKTRPVSVSKDLQDPQTTKIQPRKNKIPLRNQKKQQQKELVVLRQAKNEIPAKPGKVPNSKKTNQSLLNRETKESEIATNKQNIETLKRWNMVSQSVRENLSIEHDELNVLVSDPDF